TRRPLPRLRAPRPSEAARDFFGARLALGRNLPFLAPLRAAWCVSRPGPETDMAFPPTHPALARALAARGSEGPTPVQAAVLGEGSRERDLLVPAQTGSGKTVAFGLAAASTLLGELEAFDAPAAPL